MRTYFCMFDIAILYLNENADYHTFFRKCNEHNKEEKWLYYTENIYDVSCLDFVILEIRNKLSLDILFVFDDVSNYGENLFIDNPDCDFSSCLAYAIDVDDNLQKLQTSSLDEFYSPCKITLFEEHLRFNPIEINQNFRLNKKMKIKTYYCLFDVGLLHI